MDFASLMSKHIDKAKATAGGTSSSTTATADSQSKSKPTTTASSAAASVEQPKKYLKRSEIEAQREAQYLAEQKALEEERAAKAARKRQAEEEEAEAKRRRDERRRKLAEETRALREQEEAEKEQERRRRLGLPPVGKTAGGMVVIDGEEVGPDIPDKELREKLVGMGLKATDGDKETHENRLRRYWKHVKAEEKRRQAVIKNHGPIPSTLEPVPEADMKVARKLPKPDDKAGREFLSRQLTSYFNLILSEWEIALDNRDDSVKESFTGRAAARAMQQAKDDLRPLFKKLELEELEDTLLEPVVEIVWEAQERRYVAANDAYLRLSIGKAAWPIGVTMVGIHERSAREKLHANDKNQAHIMSDETTRKFLQSIKRCLTFAQTRWPPHDAMQLMG